MRFIIWGYPLHSHTHSYIHYGWCKALKYLGHQVEWYDDNNYPTDHNWDDCVFITEGFADGKIPVCEKATYIVHAPPNPRKYIGKCRRFIDMRYSDVWHCDHIYDYTLDKSSVTKLGPAVYYQPAASGVVKYKNDYLKYTIPDYEKIYMTWGTDLLPNEVNFDWIDLPREPVIYFSGSLVLNGRCENMSVFKPFIHECDKAGIQFVGNDPFANPLSMDEVRRRTQKSILGVDLRGPEHLHNGYVPCRVFKNISYGHIGMTNSLEVFKELEGHCVYSQDPALLFHLAMSAMNDKTRIRNAMMYVMENHTFVNRVKALLEVL